MSDLVLDGEGLALEAGDEAAGGRSASGRLHGAFAALPSTPLGLLLHVVLHPDRALRIARMVKELPVHPVALSHDGDAGAVEAGLKRQSRFARALVAGTTSVLPIPEDSDAYLAGNSRRTMRKRRNAAVRAGVRVEAVAPGPARTALLAAANEQERIHPDERYRTAHPDNADMLPLRGWLVAVADDGTPLVLAVVAVDGSWALLRYLRMLRQDPLASAARFLLMEAVVGSLAAEGVRFLATDMSPVRMSPGLREFQHRTGFELARVRLEQKAL